MFNFMQDTRFCLWNFYAHDRFVGVKTWQKTEFSSGGCEPLALVAPYNGYIELGLIPGQFLPRLITYQIRPV